MWGVRWYADSDTEPLGFADVSTSMEAKELEKALQATGWTVDIFDIPGTADATSFRGVLTVSEILYG